MSSANEIVSISLPSETYDPDTTQGAFEDNEPCWCVECGWDGVEDELMFTNDGVFVCPQCGGEDTDYFYSEDASNCVFCGSHDVVGVIDIVSLNEIHEATPLDQEQVYGYCARCADVKMAEGSTGDQIVSWEDGAGVSSPSMPPSDIKWAESKKDRIASGRAMHYAIPNEKKYPIWDKAHARMALAWSQGTKYADKVEKAVTKRFPAMNAEMVYRNYPGRKGPALSATSVKRGTRKRGNDGKMWEVRKSGRSQRWFRGAESFEASGAVGKYLCLDPDHKWDKSSMKLISNAGPDPGDQEIIMDCKVCGAQGTFDYGYATCAECKGKGAGCNYCGGKGRIMHNSWDDRFDAEGEPDAPYDQGYDDQQDESLGERNVTTGEQSLKDRRDEADAMDKKTGRKYHDVGTMDPKMIYPTGRGSGWGSKVKFPVEPSGRKHWNPGVDPESRLVPESVTMDAENTWSILGDSSDLGLFEHDSSDCDGTFEPREIHYECNECNEWHIDDYQGWVGRARYPPFGAENMGLTQYVGSAGGSSQGTPVSYGGIALPESDVASLVATDNPMDATIGTVTGTMGAEEVPVVPDPSSFPQGYGRVLGQQTDQANLSPLHAEDEDVQMVKIQDPVMTGAKMAIGVVALNATAIVGAALIGLALTHAARKEE